MASAEEYRRAGLYDPVLHRETGRLELLEWIAGHGFSIADMQLADRTGGLERLPSDTRLRAGDTLAIEEAARLADLPIARLQELALALGFVPIAGGPTDDVGLTETEARILGALGPLSELFSDEEAIALLRVVGAAMGRIGEAGVSAFLSVVEGPQIRAQATEAELAQFSYDAAAALDGFGQAIEPLLRRHIMQAIDRTRLSTIDESERYEFRYAVGFVDLVGFTGLSGDMSSRDLGLFLRDFEGRAHNVVTSSGANLVKLIGDEIMFVAVDPNAAVEAASALMSGFAHGHENVVPRGGLSFGDVLLRGGDYYGPVVNLAARLVDAAVPGELLVTEELAAAAADCEFEPAGRRSLKGFSEPVRVRSHLAAP